MKRAASPVQVGSNLKPPSEKSGLKSLRVGVPTRAAAAAVLLIQQTCRPPPVFTTADGAGRLTFFRRTSLNAPTPHRW